MKSRHQTPFYLHKDLQPPRQNFDLRPKGSAIHVRSSSESWGSLTYEQCPEEQTERMTQRRSRSARRSLLRGERQR